MANGVRFLGTVGPIDPGRRPGAEPVMFEMVCANGSITLICNPVISPVRLIRSYRAKPAGDRLDQRNKDSQNIIRHYSSAARGRRFNVVFGRGNATARAGRRRPFLDSSAHYRGHTAKVNLVREGSAVYCGRMLHTLDIALFLVLIAALATLIRWEFRRRRHGPSISRQSLGSQLAGNCRLPYVPAPERRRRSMDRIRPA